MLTALPRFLIQVITCSIPLAVPIFGGRRDCVQHRYILISFLVSGWFCRRDSRLIASSSSSLVRLCWRELRFQHGKHQPFLSETEAGGALGLNGGLGNMGVSVMQLVAPLVVSLSIFAVFGSQGVKQPDGTELYLANASWIWVPFLAIFTIAAWFGMNDLATSKASIKEQLPVLKRGHLWIMSLLYLATFGSFIGFSAGFAMLSKTQFPDVQILQYAFFGPFIGALARSAGGALSDRLGGTRVTLVNFILMAIFSGLLFLTLPTDGQGGSFMAFFAVFLALFLTAGLGSGSTFQMITRKPTMIA